MEESKSLVNSPAKSTSSIDVFFQPERMQQMLNMANQFYKAGCFGQDVKNPHQAYVKILTGTEMGMSPMEAMNSLYIVNGKVTVWGMALSKRLREHGWKIEYKDCDAKSANVIISKGDEKHEYTATHEEVSKLGGYALKKAPIDKLKWHALSRLVRFHAPEIFGSVSYLAEEIEDLPREKATVEVVAKDFDTTATPEVEVEATNEEEAEAEKEETQEEIVKKVFDIPAEPTF